MLFHRTHPKNINRPNRLPQFTHMSKNGHRKSWFGGRSSSHDQPAPAKKNRFLPKMPSFNFLSSLPWSRRTRAGTKSPAVLSEAEAEISNVKTTFGVSNVLEQSRNSRSVQRFDIPSSHRDDEQKSEPSHDSAMLLSSTLASITQLSSSDNMILPTLDNIEVAGDGSTITELTEVDDMSGESKLLQPIPVSKKRAYSVTAAFEAPTDVAPIDDVESVDIGEHTSGSCVRTDFIDGGNESADVGDHVDDATAPATMADVMVLSGPYGEEEAGGTAGLAPLHSVPATPASPQSSLPHSSPGIINVSASPVVGHGEEALNSCERSWPAVTLKGAPCKMCLKMSQRRLCGNHREDKRGFTHLNAARVGVDDGIGGETSNRSWPALTVKGTPCKLCIKLSPGQFCKYHKISEGPTFSRHVGSSGGDQHSRIRLWPALTLKGAPCKVCLQLGNGQFCHVHRTSQDVRRGAVEEGPETCDRSWPALTVKGTPCKLCIKLSPGQFCKYHA
jgi:hypothetical protein